MDECTRARRPRDIVAIGASAGGVQAISTLLASLPRQLGATVLVVMHWAPDLISHLAEILATRTEMHVERSYEGAALRRGTCFVGAPHHHLTLGGDRRLHMFDDGTYRGHNIDLLFRSLAEYAPHRSVGVLLSGMLSDGTKGLLALKRAGGIALVQDPEEAEFGAMPANAIRCDGPVDLVAPVRDLAAAICRLADPNAAAIRVPGQ